MDIQRIYQRVLDVYRTCRIRSFPIDCASILKAYGFTLYTYQDLRGTNPELYAAARKYSDDAFKFRMSIFYNADGVDGRIRFSLMHELGHHMLGHNEHSAEEEEEADCFASHVLAPRILIHHMLDRKTPIRFMITLDCLMRRQTALCWIIKDGSAQNSAVQNEISTRYSYPFHLLLRPKSRFPKIFRNLSKENCSNPQKTEADRKRASGARRTTSVFV